MLRNKELKEWEILQKKYCDNDDIYRLIDLSLMVYQKKNIETDNFLSELRFDLVKALNTLTGEKLKGGIISNG